MAKVTVIRQDSDSFNREEWVFRVEEDYAGNVYIRLHRWSKSTRKTRRHGWKITAFFDASDRRNTTALPEPPAEEIIAEARARFIERIDSKSVMLYVDKRRAEQPGAISSPFSGGN